MNIGVVGVRGIPSTYSGYETFLTAMLPELVARGHKVTIYTRDGFGPLEPFQGVKRVGLPAADSKRLSTPSHGLVAALASRLRRHDVVLCCNVGNAFPLLLSRALGQRVVLNVDGQEWARGKWGTVARRVFWQSAKVAKRSANSLVTDSVAMSEVYNDQFDSPSTVIPYPWTSISTSEGADAAQRLASFDVEPGGYHLIAGRLVPENNIDRLAKVYTRSNGEKPLLVLGTANYDSPVVRRLNDLAKRDERIRIVGHVNDRADYAALVSNSCVYLHGHSVGGINPSLVEAMGCGALILALDTPFNREALGNAGRYTEEPEVEMNAQLESLESLDRAEAETYRTMARERVAERFAMSQITDAYERLLGSVAAGSRSATFAMATMWDDIDDNGVIDIRDQAEMVPTVPRG